MLCVHYVCSTVCVTTTSLCTVIPSQYKERRQCWHVEVVTLYCWHRDRSPSSLVAVVTCPIRSERRPSLTQQATRGHSFTEQREEVTSYNVRHTHTHLLLR